jgi:hypothetical protein
MDRLRGSFDGFWLRKRGPAQCQVGTIAAFQV